MRKRITLLNILSSLLLQICVVISGFIVPRITLMYFGSEINGLVSSLTQVLSYITLVEGGITGVIAANLYGPLSQKEYSKVSQVLTTSNAFFRKVGMLFAGYTLLVAITYPIAFNLSIPYVFFLTVILSMALFIQYMFSLSLKTLLNADKKGYIVSFVQILITVGNVILVYGSVYIYPSIHFMKFISGLLYIIQPIIFGRYVRSNYPINWKAPADDSLIKERWNGFAINIAYFIHSSTDITLLTLFANLSTVSVYSVYALVINGLKSIVVAITAGINPTIGQLYAKKDFKELNFKMDLYEYIVLALVSFLFTNAAVLIVPFVMIYTDGIYDTNYYQPLFGILILAAEALYLVKYPHLNLAYAANKFKEITPSAYIEAGINIVLSIVLVLQYGLIGVACGTIVAMFYRLFFHVEYTKKLLPGRKTYLFWGKLFLMFAISILEATACWKLFPIAEYSVETWIVHAVLYSTLSGIILVLISAVFFQKEVNFIVQYIKNK